MKTKLAELLLRRKELQMKVDQLKQIQTVQLQETKVARKMAHEGIDDIVATVSKVKPEDVTRAYDWHARRLRLVDAAIQQANWATEVEVQDDCMTDYKTI